MNDARTTSAPPSPPREKKGCFTPTSCLLFAVIGAGGFLVLLLVGLFVYASLDDAPARRSRPSRHSGTALRVVLSGQLNDAPLFAGGFLDPSHAPPTVAVIAHAIREAADDDGIDGLYLRCGNVGAGWALARELREAVLAFRASGKPAVAWSEGYDTKSYYVASACDRVALSPAGIALVNGFSVGLTYFKGAFDKLGVDPEFEHVGDYKSAIEVYERTGPSPEASEAMDLLLDGIWSSVLTEIAAQRKLEPAQLQQRIDRPMLAPADAVASGLFDVAASRRAVEARLASARDDAWIDDVRAADRPAATSDEPAFVDVEDYAGGWGDRGGVIALVYAEGTIVDQEGGSLFGANQIAPARYCQLIERLIEDRDVNALVLRVNSPGGSGLASDLIWEQLERFRATGRPVVVSMGDYAASGGYYISCNADWIVAQPNTITGSIGVFGGKFNLGGAFEKLGITSYTYRRGAMSDLLDLDAPMTPERRDVFRGFLQAFYDRFTGKVASGRKLEPSTVLAIAKGRVWTGQQALERKLVDELGGVEEALAKAAELARLDAWHVQQHPRPRGLIDTLLDQVERQKHREIELGVGAVGGAGVGVAELVPSAELKSALGELVALHAMLAQGGVAAYLPGFAPLR